MGFKNLTVNRRKDAAMKSVEAFIVIECQVGVGAGIGEFSIGVCLPSI